MNTFKDIALHSKFEGNVIFSDTICNDGKTGQKFRQHRCKFLDSNQNTQGVASFQDTQKIVRSDMLYQADFCCNIMANRWRNSFGVTLAKRT